MTLVCHMTSVSYFKFLIWLQNSENLVIWCFGVLVIWCSIMCGQKCFFPTWKFNWMMFLSTESVIVCRPSIDIIISLLLFADQHLTLSYLCYCCRPSIDIIISLLLFADQHLALSYLWAKLGTNSNFSLSGNALRLSAVQLSDIGNYSCSAFNDVGFGKPGFRYLDVNGDYPVLCYDELVLIS